MSPRGMVLSLVRLYEDRKEEFNYLTLICYQITRGIYWEVIEGIEEREKMGHLHFSYCSLLCV